MAVTPDLFAAPRRAHAQVDHLESVLREAILDESGGVWRGVDRDPHLFEEVGKGTDVILVAVRDHDRPQVLTLRLEPPKVRVNQFGTIFIGETDAAVDGDRRVATDQRSTVHADLVEAS